MISAPKDDLNYGILPYSLVTLEHLMAVCLYTDKTELCTAFSATFRPKYAYESIEGTKSRNRNFWHMSRLLRELIEYWGSAGEVWNKEEDGYMNGELGPFWTGMSFEMKTASFNIRLCGPCSTSKQKVVAVRFADTGGTVLQFDNIGDNNSKYLRFFDVTGISAYAEEDERYSI